jgi:hypothetical protein
MDWPATTILWGIPEVMRSMAERATIPSMVVTAMTRFVEATAGTACSEDVAVIYW